MTNRDTVLRVLAAAGDDGVAPGQLPAMTGLDDRTVGRCVAQLADRGHARRDQPRGRVFATADGLSAAPRAPEPQPGIRQVPPDPEPATPRYVDAEAADNGMRLADLDQAVARLAPPLRALVRLLVSAACARHHLCGARTSGWLSGIAVGPTQTGKTLAGLIVAKAPGLDPETAKRLTSTETEKSLWGRREQQAKDAWVIRPAPVLGWPFVIVDELDKAPAPVRRATLRLLQGETRVPGEPGQVVESTCTALVTSNTDAAVVPPEYRRRSVVVDTAGAPVIAYDLAADVLAAVPRLSYQHLRPPAGALPAGLITEMQDVLKEHLSMEGWQLADVRALESAALGRAALTGAGLDDAVADTIGDYLTCAATTGHLAQQHEAGPDQDDGQVPEPGPDDYATRSAARGIAMTLAAALRDAKDDLLPVWRAPGVPRDVSHQAEGTLWQAADVHADLGKISHSGDTGMLAEVGPVAELVIAHLAQLAAAARSHIAPVIGELPSREQAGDGRADRMFARLMDAAGHAPASIAPPADPPEHLRLVAGRDGPGGGLRLKMFADAEDQLARTSTPAAASTAAAEAVYVETARRRAAGLPPLTGADLTRYYLAAPVAPLRRAGGPPRRRLLRRTRDAS
jgi:hypothetical protein